MDEHVPQPATAEPETPHLREDRGAPDLQLLEQVERELAEVEAVLPRLDDGTYGTCDACGVRIADERLASEPTARTCAAHAVA